MRKIILTLFLLLTFFAYTQVKGGEVQYKVIFAVDSTLKEKSSRIDLMQQKAIKGSEQIKLILTFNNKLSKFYLKESIEDPDVKFAIAWANCRNVIYTNLEEKRIYYNSISNSMNIVKENEFLIYNELGDSWEIYNESKKIDNFKCFKSVKQIKYETKNGTQSKTITAWFCPEIPYSYGPKGYFGLPGLILELSDRNTTFIAEKIYLDKTQKIEFIKKGKLISIDEYQRILKARFEEVKNNLKD